MAKMKVAKSTTSAAAGKLPKPPKRYRQFIERYPNLGRAWESVNEAGAAGPLDARTRRLIKIAASMGAMRRLIITVCAWRSRGPSSTRTGTPLRSHS